MKIYYAIRKYTEIQDYPHEFWFLQFGFLGGSSDKEHKAKDNLKSYINTQ